MARKLRIQFPGAIYHVTARGNARQDVFLDQRDYLRFVERLAESTEAYQARLYMFCLMPNHFHLLLETPKANLSQFMQSLETGYTVYFNLRHQRPGHLFQGRYAACLVEGDEYLLRLSRYVHLNPVAGPSWRGRPIREKKQRLRGYKWSSYPGYAEARQTHDFVDYDPVLALMDCPRPKRRAAYRHYVEKGLLREDEVLMPLLPQSSRAIGSTDFRRWVDELYAQLREGTDHPEDVEFRRDVKIAGADEIIAVVTALFGITVSDLKRRLRGSPWRSAAVFALRKYGRLTHRQIAQTIGIKSGTGVAWHWRKACELCLAARGRVVMAQMEAQLRSLTADGKPAGGR